MKNKILMMLALLGLFSLGFSDTTVVFKSAFPESDNLYGCVDDGKEFKKCLPIKEGISEKIILPQNAKIKLLVAISYSNRNEIIPLKFDDNSLILLSTEEDKNISVNIINSQIGTANIVAE